MRPYSEDLRERIVKSRKEGKSAQEISKTFQVCVRTVQRYVKAKEQSGSLTPRKIGGHLRSRLEAHDETLCAWIAETPDLTLEEIRARCQKQLRVKIGLNALWKRIERLGLSFKKNAARRRARSARH